MRVEDEVNGLVLGLSEAEMSELRLEASRLVDEVWRECESESRKRGMGVGVGDASDLVESQQSDSATTPTPPHDDERGGERSESAAPRLRARAAPNEGTEA